jgi:hypothetical protein
MNTTFRFVLFLSFSIAIAFAAGQILASIP